MEAGLGTKKDVRRAEELYRKASLNPVYEELSDNSRGFAMIALGVIHYQGVPPFHVNYKEAKRWFEEAAKLEYAPAQYVRAMCYLSSRAQPMLN